MMSEWNGLEQWPYWQYKRRGSPLSLHRILCELAVGPIKLTLSHLQSGVPLVSISGTTGLSARRLLLNPISLAIIELFQLNDRRDDLVSFNK